MRDGQIFYSITVTAIDFAISNNAFIIRKVKNLACFIFLEDSEWFKENLHVFGGDEVEGKVYSIDWNKNEKHIEICNVFLCVSII